jgi:hypothetical protein
MFNSIFADTGNFSKFRASGDSVTFWAQETGTATNQFLRFYIGDNPRIYATDTTESAGRAFGSIMAQRTSGSNDITWYFARRIYSGVVSCTTLTSLGNITSTGDYTSSKVGGYSRADTISGYNGNTWVVNSWGITITGVDTLGKFYMASFDSLKMVRCWGSAKNASIGGSADTLVLKDSLATDSIKVAWGVGLNWLAPAVINKKWPTNPGGVMNPVYCIFRKGATTAAANLQVWTTYGLSKGRMF